MNSNVIIIRGDKESARREYARTDRSEEPPLKLGINQERVECLIQTYYYLTPLSWIRMTPRRTRRK